VGSETQHPALSVQAQSEYDSNTQQLIRELQESMDILLARRGDPLDKAVTLRDLETAGIISVAGGSGTYIGAITIGSSVAGSGTALTLTVQSPTAPTISAINNSIDNNFIRWTYTPFNGYASSKIYRFATDSPGSAVEIGSTYGTTYWDTVDTSVQYWYYVTSVNTNGVESAKSSGVQSTVVLSPAAVATYLTDQITESQLFSTLETRINQIDGTDISGDGLVGETFIKIVGGAGGDKIAGIAAYGGATSDFIIVADNFAVIDPDFITSGATGEIPFQMGTVNGVTKISMNAATYIQDATITTLQVSGATITKAQIGAGDIWDLTIGDVIQSDAGNGYAGNPGWSINNNGSIHARAITIYDAAGNVVLDSSGLGAVEAAAQQTATLAAAAWSDVSGTTNAPEDNAEVNALGLNVKINYSGYTTANNGEMYVHGYTDGVASNTTGHIWLGSVKTSVAAGSIFGSGKSGWIMLRTTGVFAHGGTRQSLAVVKNDGGSWFYDNNSAWTAFTPDQTCWVVGTCYASGSDAGGIYAATLWPAGYSFNSVGGFADLDKITASNAPTYIADLAVDTLQIANEAATIPSGYTSGVTAYQTNGVELAVSTATLQVDYGASAPSKAILIASSLMSSVGTGGDWAAANMKLRYNTTNSLTILGSTVVQQVQVNSRKGAPPTLVCHDTITGWTGSRYFFLSTTVTGESVSATGWWRSSESTISVIGSRK